MVYTGGGRADRKRLSSYLQLAFNPVSAFLSVCQKRRRAFRAGGVISSDHLPRFFSPTFYVARVLAIGPEPRGDAGNPALSVRLEGVA